MLKKSSFWMILAAVILIGMLTLLITLGSKENNADNTNMNVNGGRYDYHIYIIGTVLDLIQEEVKVADSTKYKTIGYIVSIIAYIMSLLIFGFTNDSLLR